MSLGVPPVLVRVCRATVIACGRVGHGTGERHDQLGRTAHVRRPAGLDEQPAVDADEVWMLVNEPLRKWQGCSLLLGAVDRRAAGNAATA